MMMELKVEKEENASGWQLAGFGTGRSSSNPAYLNLSSRVHVPSCGAQTDGNGQVKAPLRYLFYSKYSKPHRFSYRTNHTVLLLELLLHYSLPHLCNGEVVDHGGRVPVRIQVVVGSWEWSCSSPELVQYGREVLRVGSNIFIKMGNGEVSDFQLLPSPFFISFEYFVE